MVSKLLFGFLFSWFFIVSASAQSSNEIYKKYQQATDSVKIIGYNMSLHYQFASGSVWDRKGKAVIRSTGDGSFDFYGLQDGMSSGFMLIDGIFYGVDHNAKSFSKQNVPLSEALGSPGGQMVMRDLISTSPGIPQISVEQDNSSSIVIRLSYPDRPNDGITNSSSGS